MSSKILVRTATPSDLIDMLDLYDAGFAPWIVSKYAKYEVGAFKAELYNLYTQMTTNNLTQIYVGECDDKCVGFIVCDVECFRASSQVYATVAWFTISEEYRNSILFLKFIRVAEEWAKRSGLAIMNWGFNASKYSERLRSLFEKKGYEPFEYQYLKHL